MDYEQIAYEVADGVATVTLDRPDRLNAFTERMRVELIDAADRFDADDDVGVVVVTGRGRGFCAGADLSGGADTFVGGGSEIRSESGVPLDGGGTVTLRLFRSVKPLIAAINGPAVGVGATVTLAMDLRLASTAARFGFPFVRRGIVPDAASSWFLPRAVGMQQAMEWMLTGRVFEADEALAGGLVRSLHEPGDLLPAAYALAEEIVANTAPVSVALTRQLLWRMLGADHPMVAHRADSRGVLARGRSADAREGVSSFLEKRTAHYPDRVSAGLPDLYPGWVEPTFD